LELQEFISSGVLESYVLGTATTEEIRQVREMEKLYPEVKAEIEEIEASLIRFAEADANPSTRIKKDIEAQLFEKTAAPKKRSTVVNISSLSGPSKWMRYAVAASVGLLIGVSAFTYSLYSQLSKTQVRLSALQLENEVLADEMGKQQLELRQQIAALTDKKIELAMVMKPGSKVVPLKGMDIAPESSAMIIWNTKDKEVYINAASLPTPPQGKQYQLWAMVNGKPVDAGVFTVTEGTSFVMQKMKDMPEAQAFAVTLENEGGSATPTMEAMYLMGSV
jgi:anti-sigma-K factor RskA